jgi:HEAT repeat protein
MLVCIASVLLLGALTEQDVADRAALHLAMKNPHGALEELETHEHEFQQSTLLLKQKIRSYAALERESDLMQAFTKLEQKNQTTNEQFDEQLLEEVAWSIIRKQAVAPSSHMRIEAIMTALFTQDARSVPLIAQALQDTSMDVRLCALDCAKSLKDASIQKLVIECARSDPSAHVRTEAINTLKIMGCEDAKPFLRDLLVQEGKTIDEKLCAVCALGALTESPERKDLEKLLQSKSPYMRAYVCDVVLTKNLHQDIDLIESLLDDKSSFVQVAALQTLSLFPQWNMQKSHKKIIELAQSNDAKLSIASAHLLMLKEQIPDVALRIFQKWLENPNEQVRLLAASALAQAGHKASPYIEKILHHATSPLVRLNLAIGCIRERVHEKKAAHILVDELNHIPDRLNQHQAGIFTWIGTTDEVHVPYMARLPETKDLFCRLSLLGIAATCDQTHVEEHLKGFLKDRTWGISGYAAALLIQESDQFHIDALHKLLEDPSEEIRLQAAFLLAMKEQNQQALDLFKSFYPKANRKIKELIITAIGRIGEKKALPFLCTVLQEPFPTLRLRAAGAILQCLNH